MGAHAAAGTPQAAACASFFVATPTTDPPLGDALAWVTNIVGAVGDPARAQVGLLGSLSALLNQLRTMQRTLAANAPTTPHPALGLNVASLILVAPALADGSGIVLYGRPGSESAVTLTRAHLARLALQDVRDPWERQAVVARDQDPATLDAARLLDYLRRSSYVVIYLVPVKTAGPLADFARELADLTDTSVYWNKTPLVLERRDGVLQPPRVAARGPELHGAREVALAARDASSFLPGSEERIL